MKKSTVYTHQKSFTVIELLVVIAIIGLVSSIVLVSVRGARERARIAATKQFSDSIRASLSDALVSTWGLNEGTGTTVGDAWGRNTGTLGDGTCTPGTGSCPDWTEGVAGNALSFDGNDFVDCGNDSSLDAPTEVTIEAWVKFNNVTSGQAIVSKRIWWNTPSGYHLIFDYTTTNGIEVRGRANNYARAYDAGLATGIWYHIVGTLSDDGSKNRVYINGVNRTTRIVKTETLENNTTNVYVGSNPSLQGFFDGIIDEVRIYSRSLTVLEIQERYAKGLKKYKFIKE